MHYINGLDYYLAISCCLGVVASSTYRYVAVMFHLGAVFTCSIYDMVGTYFCGALTSRNQNIKVMSYLGVVLGEMSKLIGCSSHI